MNVCCFCDKEYNYIKEDSIQVYGEKQTYNAFETVVMYNFCCQSCLDKCYEEDNDKLLKPLISNN
ncbi:hypothetical protein U8V72_24690 [Priestia filamentosa]|uniref:hypothetical protein n=1 Tax=Priestia filamentosa TaxID=1402861 RepID=UPI000589622B